MIIEPHYSFVAAAKKIEWSIRLLNNLNHLCDKFMEENRPVVSIDKTSDAELRVLRVGFELEAPLDIPLLIGDICANLRSSLDYAWMGLIRADNPGITNKCTLPIAKDHVHLDKLIAKQPLLQRREEIRRVVLEKVKPHRDFLHGGNRALIELNELNNWNKHNLIIVSALITHIESLSWGDGKIEQTIVEGSAFPIMGITDDEANDLKVNGKFYGYLIFSMNGHLVNDKSVLDSLRYMAMEALRALSYFCDAFPDSSNPQIIVE